MNHNCLTTLIWQLLSNQKFPFCPYFQPIYLITRLFIGVNLFASPAVPIEPIKIDILIPKSGEVDLRKTVIFHHQRTIDRKHHTNSF